MDMNAAADDITAVLTGGAPTQPEPEPASGGSDAAVPEPVGAGSEGSGSEGSGTPSGGADPDAAPEATETVPEPVAVSGGPEAVASEPAVAVSAVAVSTEPELLSPGADPGAVPATVQFVARTAPETVSASPVWADSIGIPAPAAKTGAAPPAGIMVTGGDTDSPVGSGHDDPVDAAARPNRPETDRPEADLPEDGDPLDDVPEEIREAARQAPDHWLGMIDPGWEGDGIPPSWALVGEWRSDAEGNVVEWRENEDYRPSPAMLDWPMPTDPLDAALQLAATGYGPVDDLTHELSAAELLVFVQSDGDPVRATALDGTPVVPVYSSSTYLEAAGPLASTSMRVVDLVDRIPDEHMLYLNPTGPVPTVIDADLLREAIEGGSADNVPIRSTVIDAPMTDDVVMDDVVMDDPAIDDPMMDDLAIDATEPPPSQGTD